MSFNTKTRLPFWILMVFSAWACACAWSLSLQADDVFLFIVKKEEQKKQSRWTLEGWLATKERMGLMDQWLAMHNSPTLFEGVIGGDKGKYDHSDAATSNFTTGEIQLYLTIFGFEARYEDSNEPWNSSSLGLGLRLLGTAIQGTHLTLQGGMRNFNEARTYSNPYWGATLSLYLIGPLGIEGLYRNFGSDKAKEDGSSLKGSLWRGGAFIDISFLRIYGQFFKEEQTTLSDGTATKKTREGLSYGVKMFF